MKRVSALIFCFVLLSSGAVYAQAAKTQTPVAKSADAPKTPQLTDEQKAQAEKLVADFRDDEASIAKYKADEAQIAAAYQDYLKKIEVAYPGYTVNVDHVTELGHSDPILVEKPKAVKK